MGVRCSTEPLPGGNSGEIRVPPSSVLEQWLSCHGVKERCQQIYNDLTDEKATVRDPPAVNAGKQLTKGASVKLKVTQVEEEWFGVNTQAPNFVSLVGPGNNDLDRLAEIASGLPWVVFGILLCYHAIPMKKEGEATHNPTRDFSYTWKQHDGKDVTDGHLVKYPYPHEVARIMEDEEKRVRLAAHLNDTWAIDVYEGREEVLEWLEACQFRFVQLNHEAGGLEEFWKGKSMEQVARNVVAKMEKFGSLTFILPSSGNEKFQKLNNEILKKGLRNAYILHDRSHGNGKEAWIFPRPHDTVPCGYAGGFTPENMLEKLGLIRWVKGDVPYFVDLQSGLRSGIVKPPKDRRERYGIFDLGKARTLVNNMANSVMYNPAQGQEVFQGRDGRLRLGSGMGREGSFVLLPNRVYTVTELDEKRCQFKLKDRDHDVGESPFIAASIVSKLVFSMNNGAISPLRPKGNGAEEAAHNRNGSTEGAAKPVLAEALSLQEDKSCFPVEGSLGAGYGNKTPAEYLDHLGSKGQEADELKKHAMPEKRDAEVLLEKWSTGQLLTFESGLGSGRFLSLSSKGFPGRAVVRDPWEGNLKKVEGHGVAIVSIPGDNQKLFNTVTRICLEDGMSFAAVWESDWGQMWFFAWLRNTVRAFLDGYIPLVLTKERGTLGKAQSIEVQALKYLEVPFACMEIGRFVRECRPFHGAINRQAWEECKDLANTTGDLASLRKRDGEGFSPLILAVDQKAPLGLVGALISVAADPSDQDSQGRTALHWAARRLAKSTDGDEKHWTDLASLLLSARWNVSQLKSFSNRTAVEYCSDILGGRGDRLEKFKKLVADHKPEDAQKQG